MKDLGDVLKQPMVKNQVGAGLSGGPGGPGGSPTHDSVRVPTQGSLGNRLAGMGYNGNDNKQINSQNNL